MTTLTTRPYTGEADVQAICDLLNLCDATFHLEDSYDVADLRVEFSDPRLDPARDLRLWETDGRLVGFGQMWINPVDEHADMVDAFVYFRVHPELGDALDSDIIAWGEERTAELSRQHALPGLLRSGTPDTYTERVQSLQRHGFAVSRYFYNMARPLDTPIPAPTLPNGYTVRHTASDADIALWVDAFNGSFIDHWNHHPATVESHTHWLKNDPQYVPENDLIAVAPDGSIAAFCFCHVDTAGNARNHTSEGWVNLLGVQRGHRKLGLGRAMLFVGMRRMQELGLATARLGVDAESPTGALRLYESVGFTQVGTRVSFSKSVKTGTEEQQGS